VTGTEWLFRYPQNKRNNGRRNGDCLAARWFPQGKTAQLFVTGELYSLDKEPLMGDPINLPAEHNIKFSISSCYLIVFLVIHLIPA